LMAIFGTNLTTALNHGTNRTVRCRCWLLCGGLFCGVILTGFAPVRLVGRSEAFRATV
jgi:hypothetical protein